MSDQPPPPSSSTQAASGPPGYENQNSTSHLPPPPIPPPINIPSAANSIQPGLTSPLGNGGNLISPGPSSAGAGGFLRRAAPEPNKRALYVGGLDPRVNEEMLKQIFESGGSHVMTVKIIPDKNFHSKGLNYGFVEYDDPAAAERALQTLNGRKIHGAEIRVNWAYQSNSNTKEDTSNHYHVFVGDLSNEVNDDILLSAFSPFGQVSEARVMWDMKTGRTRGYGFVAYRDRTDAEKSIQKMDGEWLGSRTIRCNWANQKGQPSMAQQQVMASLGIAPSTAYNHHPFPSGGMQAYQEVLSQSPAYQTTIYVGNLTPYTQANDLVPLFLNFGQVLETRMQADRGFAFLRLESHEQAASAICQLNGYMINGRPIKCSWGKDRPPTMTFDPSQVPTGNPISYPYSPQAGSPSAYPYAPSPQSYQSPQGFPGGSPAPGAGGGAVPYGSPPPNGGQYAYPGSPQGGNPPGVYQQGGYGRGQQAQNQGQWGGQGYPGAGGYGY